MLGIKPFYKYYFLNLNVLHLFIQLFLYTLIDFCLFINMTVYLHC